jgi:predicted RNA-binding protein YlxR (DUF448 family)
MCIVTREVKDEAKLIRFVRSPDGVVVPDLKRKLPGRGVWVSLARQQVEEAVRKGLFARGFAAASTADPTLPETVAQLQRQEAVALLSLARKAGEALAGFMRVEEALSKGPVRLLLHASGAKEDGVRKLDRLAGPKTAICGLLTSAEMDLAFGRANVVHAAVAAGGLADKLAFCMGRIAAYEGLAFKDVESEIGL